MLGLDWSELALIGVVALVVIGPKDLPEAVRGLAAGVRKLRRMAGEFQQQADELVKEANLSEVRQHINDIRSFNLRDEVERNVDGDGSIRRAFSDDPFRPDVPAAAPAAAAEIFGPPATDAPADVAPAFIPPEAATGAPAAIAAAPDAARAN